MCSEKFVHAWLGVIFKLKEGLRYQNRNHEKGGVGTLSTEKGWAKMPHL